MIVYTVGTFDLLHVGHLALLEYCATLGDVVAVGVASDRVVKSYKPNTPVIPLDQRLEMLQALRCVDIVRPYHELEYVSGCKILNADILSWVKTGEPRRIMSKSNPIWKAKGKRLSGYSITHALHPLE